jgi:hypothetical protein
MELKANLTCTEFAPEPTGTGAAIQELAPGDLELLQHPELRQSRNRHVEPVDLRRHYFRRERAVDAGGGAAGVLTATPVRGFRRRRGAAEQTGDLCGFSGPLIRGSFLGADLPASGNWRNPNIGALRMPTKKITCL